MGLSASSPSVYRTMSPAGIAGSAAKRGSSDLEVGPLFSIVTYSIKNKLFSN
jgi:hypothetical protein